MLLLLAGWSVRSSRRDPRLVGRWRMEGSYTDWLLKADGSFWVIADDAREIDTTREWYVDRGWLYLTPAGGYWTGISKDLRNYRLKGKTPPPWSTYVIVSISDDHFVVRDPPMERKDLEKSATFTRVP